MLGAQEARLTRVVEGLNAPVDIQSARDGSGRLFVAEQGGTVRVVENGLLRPAPFLDIRAKTRSDGECGLLGLAFPPGFRESQRFYVSYTDTQCLNTILARYRVGSAAEEVILTQPKPFTNHNGGSLAFGTDGFLYIGFGDGGSPNDSLGNGQNRRTWLGKILRIDVESGAATYRVPPDNPFVRDASYLPEIWSLGLRNPWRFSFDRLTGDMWIGDVGQNRAEEIDRQPAGRGGLNFGWRVMEGLSCFAAPGCDVAGLTPPVLEYTRERDDRSVIGGFMYRGLRWANLAGTYVYGDFVSGRIWGLRQESGALSNRVLIDFPFTISSFGEDESGELYVAAYGNGSIYLVEGTVPRAPSLVTPANGSTLTSSAITFSWTPAPSVGQSYELKVFNAVTDSLELSLSILPGLLNQVYTFRSGDYRIEFKDCTPQCGPAAISTFRVQLPAVPGAAPQNVSCTASAQASQNQLNCSWSQLAGSDFYFFNVVQPNTGPGGGALTVAGSQSGPNAVSLAVPNGPANVVVRACNGDGCGPSSAKFPVSPNAGNPTTPAVAEPFGGSVIDAGSAAPGVTFVWNRVAGDTGSNYKYRLYVQDFSRNAAAIDLITSNNFHAAYMNPFTRYDALVVAIPNSGGPPSQGPAQGFRVKGKIPNSPSYTQPTVFSNVLAGTVTLAWTPIPDSRGVIAGRRYQYFLAGDARTFTGVTAEVSVNLTLTSGIYSGTVRVCGAGITCTAGAEAGWGPWAGTPGSEGGYTSFTVSGQ